ncbi:MAG TPA: DUF308 domain-containing protein [Burkholderiaceae bacterium]|nr:DUF308 domain-containing protein [Burkholderiaceae bacterium]
MHGLLKRAWWALLIGGIASVLFGVLAFIWPGLTLLVLAIFFAASVFVDGVVMLIGAFRHRGGASHWWLWLLIGLLGIVAGGIGLASPATAAGALLLLIAAYAISAGVLMIWAGIKLRAEIEREWLLWIMGGVSVLFGVLLIAQPAAGLMGFVWAIAVWAIAEGILKIMLAFKARSFKSRLEASTGAAA